MRPGILLMVAALGLSSTGCFTRRIAEKAGISGWFRGDASTNSMTYRGRFEAIPLEDEARGCPSVRASTEKPIVVLVHGIGGEGPEMFEAIPKLSDWQPPALFMFRWVAWDDRDEVAQRLADGLSHLQQCAPAHHIVVIAHSAGGIVSSHAASRVRTSSDHPIDLLTVASPLAGTVRRAGNADGRAEATLMLDLGSRITRYPAAVTGMHVVHLRSQAPADSIMNPVGDLVPNDPKVGVPGAAQLDLPKHLDHSGALVWVVDELIAGRATPWLSPSMPSSATVSRSRAR